jgi:hypothetical protein
MTATRSHLGEQSLRELARVWRDCISRDTRDRSAEARHMDQLGLKLNAAAPQLGGRRVRDMIADVLELSCSCWSAQQRGEHALNFRRLPC